MESVEGSARKENIFLSSRAEQQEATKLSPRLSLSHARAHTQATGIKRSITEKSSRVYRLQISLMALLASSSFLRMIFSCYLSEWRSYFLRFVEFHALGPLIISFRGFDLTFLLTTAPWINSVRLLDQCLIPSVPWDSSRRMFVVKPVSQNWGVI